MGFMKDFGGTYGQVLLRKINCKFCRNLCSCVNTVMSFVLCGSEVVAKGR